ncbi:hypothetical protein HN784_03455 [bacterium]|jgi:thymidylate kinase|nr:hypothetical protein [bacterium]MBT4251352.1 hypothetical protein [bacterium]MBT4598267.1 hypothetical protein [bacterium]MBT6754100.1 hypothetical protein [bacterium]MBT7037920.1 hypothetical protein [bacterium]
MQLITISGLDGSGKTTQLDKLERSLKDANKKVSRFHITEFSIAKKILGRRKENSSKPARAVVSANSFTITLRKIALIIDATRFNQLFRKLSSGYDYLLTDRYFYDQIVNIRYLEKINDGEKIPAWQRLAEKLIKKPDIALFIEVSPEVAVSRDRDIEQGKQFLINKQCIFDYLIKHWEIKLINGEGTACEVFKKIKEISKI